MVDGMMNMSFKRVSFFISFPFEVPCGRKGSDKTPTKYFNSLLP